MAAAHGEMPQAMDLLVLPVSVVKSDECKIELYCWRALPYGKSWGQRK